MRKIARATPNYYPMTVGNTWVLETPDGEEQRTYTLEGPEIVNGVACICLKVGTQLLGTDLAHINRYFMTESDAGIQLHQAITDEGTFGIVTTHFSPPVTFIPSSLAPGDTWEIVAPVKKGLLSAKSTITLTVVNFEDIVTPAGVFAACLKIESKSRVSAAFINIRSTEYQWLAPNVGPIKYQDNEDNVFELVRSSLFDTPV